MTPETIALTATAFLIGVVHTTLGPDHYLPFVALARARGWTLARTLRLALICGAVHVASSVVLGLGGFAGGWLVADLLALDRARGSAAAWLLLGLGLAYGVWGLRRALRPGRHSHLHAHADGTIHKHSHEHVGSHAHPHADATGRTTGVAWGLFIVFVLGPCEPLIPLFFYPAAKGGSATALVAVVAAFTLATLATTALLVWFAHRSIARLATRPGAGLERWSHALAGCALVVCALAIHLGL